jgi:hypothetical protein
MRLTSILMLMGSLALAASAEAGDSSDAIEREVTPLVREFCWECHRGSKAKGGVDLASQTNSAAFYRNPKVWETVVRSVEDREMPPTGADLPTETQRLQLLDALQTLLDHPDPRFVVADPGAKSIHRLNRTEYNRTVQDLLGVTLSPADAFPADGGGGAGFDNNADTLYVPPILMERYLGAADDLLAVAPEERLFPVQSAWYRTERETARRNLLEFTRRAFRRPADGTDITRLLGFYDRNRRQGNDAKTALRAAYKVVLVSPKFLFRIEQERDQTTPWRVDAYELASRLSYFLWSSTPDEELLASAENRSLLNDAELDCQVRRMLADPKAHVFVEQFTSQWLGTKTLHTTAHPDRRKYPHFSDGLRDAMAAEPVEFVWSLIQENASALRLLDADYTFANAELARLYGLPEVASTNLVRVSLPNRNRGGITGMAAVLTQTSYPLRTSPVLRGKWILEEVLGTPPPPPPPLVATLPPDDVVKEGLTFRQRLEEHRNKPQCASCHARLDPIGFALENFDAIGAWRDSIDGKPVDATGILTNGEVVEGPVQLKNSLMARRDLFLRHLTEKLMAYALGRGLEFHDIPSVKEVLRKASTNDHRLNSMILEIVRSYPFQWRRRESAAIPNPSPTPGY